MNKETIITVLKTIVDPEIGIDIYTLGLIYNIKTDETTDGGDVDITMTFTSPMCPYGPQLLFEVESKLKEAGAQHVNVEVTFDPPWQPSEELRELLGV